MNMTHLKEMQQNKYKPNSEYKPKFQGYSLNEIQNSLQAIPEECHFATLGKTNKTLAGIELTFS